MTDFRLDPRLAADTFALGQIDAIHIRLMNNAELPWFILVPETDEVEMYALPAAELDRLQQVIALLCRWLETQYAPDKLNVAAIGNIVRQLHVHVVARREGDYCWPGVVWGSSWQSRYQPDRVSEIRKQLTAAFPDRFVPA